MVMATPSPQQVGREFVRQYYTVLHEAPDVLHRFYSSGSTFVHGGVDQPDRPFEEPVVGQLEIDKKIKNLNFKDCHTKIRQVDSQLTIGSGVVVQVTGELSNNGEPMRRFMQTFVLAPQTPKKFYVHNDIFRYQDEVYQDNSDTESEDQHIEASLITKTAVLNMNNYYEQNHQQEETTGQQSTSSMSSSLPILTSPTHADQQHQQQQQIMEQADLTIQPASVEDQNGHTNGHMNTNTSMEDSNVSTNQVPVESVPVVEAQPVVLESEIPVESVNNVKEEIQAQTTETKINSWAKLVQSSGASVLENTGMLAGGNSQVYQTSQYLPSASAPKFGNKEQANTPNNNQTAGKQAKTNGGPKTNHNNKSRNQEGGRGGNQQQSQSAQQDKGQAQQQQQPREPREPKEPRVAGDEDEKKFGRYPDGQQVFVGNLNQDLSEAELRTYFSQYGKVMDMRINTNSKQQSGRRLPNYGFVVFEEKQAVENLLSASKANSITYKNDKGVEYRLNVEEKRARQGRISSGFNKQSNNRNTRSTSNGSRNGGQQQQQGGERQERPKKNNNYSQSSNTQETQGYERREGGFNNRKSDVNHDGQMVDNGPRRNNASNPRRS